VRGRAAARRRRGVPRRPSRAGATRWAELRVITSPDAADAVAAMLWDLRVGGVAEDRLSPAAVRLRCYLPPSRARAVALRLLRARRRGRARYGLDPGRSSVTGRTAEIGEWGAGWREAGRA